MYIKTIYRYLFQILDYVTQDHRDIYHSLTLEVAAVKNQSINKL